AVFVRRNVPSPSRPPNLTLHDAHPISSALEIQAESKERIKNGISAVLAMEELGRDPNNEQALAQFEAHKADVGSRLLLQKYAPEIEEHTSELQSRFDLVISLLLEIKKH